MKKALRTLAVPFCAALMAIAPGLDLSVQPKVLPDAAGFWDLCYQAVARTADAVTADRISLAVLFCVSVWLCLRFLFHRPSNAGAGEKLLCALLAALMLLERAIRVGGSVGLLYENAFQMIKAVFYGAGFYLGLLMALRGLNTLLNTPTAVRAPYRWIARQNGRSLFGWLALCWLPHLMIKYPGVLMWDTYQQMKQFLGEYARQSNHPPLGTLQYGLMARLGEALGNPNLSYCLYMLAQTAALLAVLAYTLTVMKKLGVSPRVRLGAFALYIVSPCYVGWATVICKDTQYLILCLWLGALLLQFAREGFPFLQRPKNAVALVAALSLIWLTRYNGAIIAGIVLLAMAAALSVRGKLRVFGRRFGAVALAVIVLGAGGNELLLRVMNVQKIYLYDVYSLPFLQTARVVNLHADELPADERAAIDRVLEYDVIGESYQAWYADSVKDTYRFSATAADRAEYLRVWLRQMFRYPLDYLDAAISLNGMLFDLQENRPMYVGLTDNALSSRVYPYSFNDMTLYNRTETSPLNAAQRALTQWYFSFDRLPLIGCFASMGFCMDLLLMMLYLCVINRRKKALWALIPSIVTAVGCLFVPVVYLRYALPFIGSLPLWFAAFDAEGTRPLPAETGMRS